MIDLKPFVGSLVLVQFTRNFSYMVAASMGALTVQAAWDPTKNSQVFVDCLVCYVHEVSEGVYAICYPDPRGSKQNVLALIDPANIAAISTVVAQATNLQSTTSQSDNAGQAETATDDAQA